jgi:hypothetical protein
MTGLRKSILRAFQPNEQAGFTRRGGRWSKRGVEPVASHQIELQKSDFGEAYFVKVLVFPTQFGDLFVVVALGRWPGYGCAPMIRW